MVTVDYVHPDLKALKGSFVADMHFHTRYSHDCTTKVGDILKLARHLGVHVAITDHNQIGGVLEALKEKGAPIIPAIEICSSEGKEVIPYFYDAGHLQEFYEKRLSKYLKEKNPLRSSRTSITLKELLAMLAEEECVVCLPHPFAPAPRQSYRYVSRRNELAKQFDVVEVFNQMMPRRANLSALGWAVSLRRGISGGSDGHSWKQLGEGVTVSSSASYAEHLDAMTRGDVKVFGTELKAHQRAFNYAQTTVKNKLHNGVAGGIKKGLGFPMRASRRILDELKR